MCTPLLPKMHTPRPFVKRCYGRKCKKLRSDRFRNATKPYIVKKYRKALQIKDFIKRNWTPIKIRMVSKLVSSYGASGDTAFFKKHSIDDETVSFNVSLKKFGNNQGQIKEVLEIVGLQGREKDKALVLSGGEKQRLGIARAILKNASVIFADEPTASLDNSNRQLVVSLLKDCTNRGAAIILATHDERLVAECDTVVRLGT